MDRFSDGRNNFEPSDSDFDSDQAVSRDRGQKARRKSRDAKAEEVPDAGLDPQDEGEEGSERQFEKPPEHHPHRVLHPPFPTHRPTFGRKGL
jgi:hypothetical protein